MTYDYLHRPFIAKKVTGGYCEKCERETPHRNLVCSVCKSTNVGKGENTLKVHLRKNVKEIASRNKSKDVNKAIAIYYAKLNNNLNKGRRAAHKSSAAKFRAMFEGENK